VENPLLEVVKHADLHCVEEVRHREVASDAGTMLKNVESLVDMARREFGIG
jgi:DNA-directed RNA polymerase specialized sigma24 family protein